MDTIPQLLLSSKLTQATDEHILQTSATTEVSPKHKYLTETPSMPTEFPN